jgi:hypothetical protein
MTQRYTLPLLAFAGCLLLLGLAPVERAAAQESRSLNVGTTLYNTNETLNGDDIIWPRAQPARSGDRVELLETYGVIIGVRRTWTDGTGVTRDIQIAQVAQNKFSDIELVTPPVPDAFKRTYRNPYPSKVLDGTDWADIVALGDPVDPDLPADVVIYNHLNTWTGIDIERWAYAFAGDVNDDFVILEHVFTNTSGETRNDVYFGLTAELMAHTYYPADLWGTYYGADYQNYVAGDASADSMRLYYAWDGDQTSADPTIDTRAKPDAQWGDFQEPQYAAYVVLHADASPSDESDDPAQPWKAGWSQRELAPDLNVAGHEDIYQYLTEGWAPSNPGAYATTLDTNGEIVPAKNGPYRVLDPSIDINNTTQYDPLTEQEKTSLLSFGPYTLGPGEDVRIVTAFAMGQIPYRWAIDAGFAYQNGNPQQRPLVPLPYDIVNPFTGELVAAQGATLDKQTKNDIIDLSRLFAFDNASKAIRTWKNGNVRSGQGSFAADLAPAAPSLEGFSENDQVRLTWGDEAQNDCARRGCTIDGYRIYREFTRPASIALPTDTTFLLHAEVPAGTFEFVDADVVRGENYYYYVTAVTSDGLESSEYLNRTGTTGEKFREALTPTRPPAEDWEQSVVVVPNPFHIQGASNYESEKRIVFLNLPAYANIHIYTMTGDRVQTLEHDSSTGDDDWDRQETFSTMEIVSGIYIFVVEELDGPRGGATGRQAMGKFVVIK